MPTLDEAHQSTTSTGNSARATDGQTDGDEDRARDVLDESIAGVPHGKEAGLAGRENARHGDPNAERLKHPAGLLPSFVVK
jgi:hypothetical protein